MSGAAFVNVLVAWQARLFGSALFHLAVSKTQRVVDTKPEGCRIPVKALFPLMTSRRTVNGSHTTNTEHLDSTDDEDSLSDNFDDQ